MLTAFKRHNIFVALVWLHFAQYIGIMFRLYLNNPMDPPDLIDMDTVLDNSSTTLERKDFQTGKCRLCPAFSDK